MHTAITAAIAAFGVAWALRRRLWRGVIVEVDIAPDGRRKVRTL